MKKATGVVLALAGLLTGCARQQLEEAVGLADYWHIKAYDQGVFTIQHKTLEYRAVCWATSDLAGVGGMRAEIERRSHDPIQCRRAMQLVGKHVQAKQPGKPDSTGVIYTMQNAPDDMLWLTVDLINHPSEHPFEYLRITAIRDVAGLN